MFVTCKPGPNNFSSLRCIGANAPEKNNCVWRCWWTPGFVVYSTAARNFFTFLRQENNKILRCLKLCENYNFERRYWLQVIYDVVVSCGEIGPQKLMIMFLYIHLTETETLCDLVI